MPLTPRTLARAAVLTHEIHVLTHFCEDRVVYEDDGPAVRGRYHPALPTDPARVRALEAALTVTYETIATEILSP